MATNGGQKVSFSFPFSQSLSTEIVPFVPWLAVLGWGNEKEEKVCEPTVERQTDRKRNIATKAIFKLWRGTHYIAQILREHSTYPILRSPSSSPPLEPEPSRARAVSAAPRVVPPVADEHVLVEDGPLRAQEGVLAAVVVAVVVDLDRRKKSS